MGAASARGCGPQSPPPPVPPFSTSAHVLPIPFCSPSISTKENFDLKLHRKNRKGEAGVTPHPSGWRWGGASRPFGFPQTTHGVCRNTVQHLEPDATAKEKPKSSWVGFFLSFSQKKITFLKLKNCKINYQKHHKNILLQ